MSKKPKKRQAGRPQMADAERRDAIVRFRCRPSEADLIRRAAKVKGKSVTDYARDTLVRAARRATGG